jgi:hypothetical protein
MPGAGVALGPGKGAGEQGDGVPCDPGDRGGSAGGVEGRGGGAQARGAPSASGSGEASDEWVWSDGAPGRRRVGRSQDAGTGGGHAQEARGGLHAVPLVLLAAKVAQRVLRKQRWSKRIGGGLERATEVCAVQDGAEWRPRLVDYHRADAVRILDFAHAAPVHQ